MWDAGDVECSGCGIGDVWDVWYVRDVGCSECGMMGMWNVRDVECRLWDVFRGVGC